MTPDQIVPTCYNMRWCKPHIFMFHPKIIAEKYAPQKWLLLSELDE